MRILFTGASSFTGYWFARALALGGHHVTAVFTTTGPEVYNGIRRQRVDTLPALIERRYSCAFGSEAMLSLIREEKWDLLCHHGAVVGPGYRSNDFDYQQAFASNTHNVDATLKALHESGCTRLLVTGSYSESDEGTGSSVEAFSPYSLSKTLSWQTFRYFAAHHGLTLGKFTISNPFGAFEEARFSAYLAKCWLQGKTPSVMTPDYIRDYMPVDLMAAAYRQLAESLLETKSSPVLCNPSFWVETNLAFAQRMAGKLAPIFGVNCPVDSQKQTDFSEPLDRRNTQPVDAAALSWDEAAFWNELAAYYKTLV